MEIYDRRVPDLQNPGDDKIIVLRNADKVFWDTCLEASKKNHPVCGVGNPGIGKTTTTLYLLQKIIMEEKSPVVYTIRCNLSMPGIYYELAPVVKNGQVDDIKVIVHKKKHENMESISTLQNENAFYVVDQGKFQGSCDDVDHIEARFIMTASNNCDHWGGEEFAKDRQSDTYFGKTTRPNELPGVFVYGHLWTAPQVLAVRRYFPSLEIYSKNEILQRYRIFEGSIRDIKMTNKVIFEKRALGALGRINETTINELIDGLYEFAFKPDQLSSRIIGIGPEMDEPTDSHIVFLKSDYVEELVVEKWLRNSWYSVQNEDNIFRRNLFEAFVRRKFYSQQVHFGGAQVRESRRERPDTAGMRRNYEPVTNGMKVGSKRKVLRVSNLAESVREDAKKEFLYYSMDQSEPFIDMIYRVDDGYEAIQATISKKYDAVRDKIKDLKNALHLQSSQKLRIFYAVPSVRYDEFVTDPVNPLDTNGYDFSNIIIYHLSIDGDRFRED